MIAIVALVLAVLELAFLALAGVLAVKFWRTVEPHVRPLIAMFSPATSSTSSSSASASEHGPDGPSPLPPGP